MNIYLVTNTINNKCYIGQTINNIHLRFRAHCNKALRQKDNLRNSSFHHAIRKYGRDCWTVELLCQCSSKKEMDEMEQYYIAYYNTFKGEGYNSAIGGRGTIGYKHTDEAKAKLSRASLGRKMSKESSERKSQANKKFYSNPENAALRKKQIQQAFDNKIYQYDEQMKLIKIWPSERECKLSGSPGARYSLRTGKFSKGFLYTTLVPEE